MEVAFDPAKDAENIKKHGISLKRAEDFDDDSALYDLDDSQDYGEERWNLVGWLDANLHTLLLSISLTTKSASSVSATPPHRSKKTMPKNTEIVTEPEYGVPDAENPEWTKEKFARALRFDQLPEHMQRALKRGKRGPQKTPTKQQVTLRLSQDVLLILRAKGRGWQTLVDDTLRKHFLKASK